MNLKLLQLDLDKLTADFSKIETEMSAVRATLPDLSEDHVPSHAYYHQCATQAHKAGVRLSALLAELRVAYAKVIGLTRTTEMQYSRRVRDRLLSLTPTEKRGRSADERKALAESEHEAIRERALSLRQMAEEVTAWTDIARSVMADLRGYRKDCDDRRHSLDSRAPGPKVPYPTAVPGPSPLRSTSSDSQGPFDEAMDDAGPAAESTPLAPSDGFSMDFTRMGTPAGGTSDEVSAPKAVSPADAPANAPTFVSDAPPVPSLRDLLKE